MKRIVSDILRTRLIAKDVTDCEKEAFSQYSHVQRYHPGLDLFPTIEMGQRKNMTLPYQYELNNWNIDASANSIAKQGKYWICNRKKIHRQNTIDLFEEVPVETVEELEEKVRVFVKIIHLLDPIGILRHEYMTPEHPLIPQGEKAWRHTLQKLHSPNNQAYVDTVASYVLSRFRELDLTPHCTLAYGSITGIAKSYKYRISDDYSSYRQCRWFWRGIQTQGAKLEVLRDSEELSQSSENKALLQEHFNCPFNDNESVTQESITDLSSDNLPSIENIEDGTNSLHSFTFDDNQPVSDKLETSIPFGKQARRRCESHQESLESESKSSDSIDNDGNDDNEDNDESEDSNDEDDSLEVNLELPSMPVILVYQECQEGTMDELLDVDEIKGYEKGTKEYERIWLAWVWQIISVLGFLQKSICFTHNDLHTNNIVWRNTDQEYLYYKSRDETIWRVPTYGKIFSLIDFGRSIFRLGKQLWISDDHWPEHEAGGQYNFGPIYNIHQPKVPPNPSFDLCRLAVSLIDGLYDDIPKKKKGRNVSPLSKDGFWIVHETVSPLFNLLFSWTVDDSGKTLYQDESGDERYPGFDLYVHIARDIHKAVPRDQYTKPVFDIFRFKDTIPTEMTVYSLGY